MPRFAANLTLMYNEWEFLQRFDRAAEDGFAAVEYLFPYAWPAAALLARLQGAGLVQALFNAPPGDWEAGERGLAAQPGREDEFRRGVAIALDYAAVLGNTRLHVMAGLRQGEPAAQLATYLANLEFAARAAEPAGVTIVIEPINPRDMPGYYLNRQDAALEAISAVGAENLALLFDLYHCQIVEGDLATRLRANLPHIAHMQVAGVPGRHEPDVGEINYPYLFGLADELGYGGWIGCEYRPKAGTRAGLGWMRRAPLGFEAGRD